jgi:hypothetical protein
VVVEPRGRLAEQLGDLLGGARLLGEQLEHAQAQRMRERTEVRDVGGERRSAGRARGRFGTSLGHGSVYVDRGGLAKYDRPFNII